MLTRNSVGATAGGAVGVAVGTPYGTTGIHVVGTDVAGDCDRAIDDVVDRTRLGRDDMGERVGASVLSSGVVGAGLTTTRT